jgi:hypothetical protein
VLVEELLDPPVVTVPPPPVVFLLAGRQAVAQRPASKASPTTRVLVWLESFIRLSPLDLLGDGQHQALSSVAITRADLSQRLARAR